MTRGIRRSVIAALFLIGVGITSEKTFSDTALTHFVYLGQISGLKGKMSLQADDTAIELGHSGPVDLSAYIEKAPQSLTVIQSPIGQTCILATKESSQEIAEGLAFEVKCQDNHYRLLGEVSGLKGQLLLQTQWGSTQLIESDGQFTLSQGYPLGTPYHLSIIQTPQHQHCIIKNSSGIVSDHVNDIVIHCENES